MERERQMHWLLPQALVAQLGGDAVVVAGGEGHGRGRLIRR